jgi:hypothetical protein
MSRHHAPCSGRWLFLAADSRESNRTIAMNWSSSVNP